MKRLLNYHEEETHSRLLKACDRNSARVFAKVRVADVLPSENSGISDDLFKFALQSHFDFVFTVEGGLVLFAVEFDGPSHGNAAEMVRDAKKDAVCKRWMFSALRIIAAFNNRR